MKSSREKSSTTTRCCHTVTLAKFNAYFLKQGLPPRNEDNVEFPKLRFAAQIPCLFRTRHP